MKGARDGSGLDLQLWASISSWSRVCVCVIFRLFTMARTTRQGHVATPAVVASTIGVSDKQQRVQKKAEKARKKHEKEQSKKA